MYKFLIWSFVAIHLVGFLFLKSINGGGGGIGIGFLFLAGFIIIEIVYIIVNEFQSEEDFNSFCLDANNTNDMDDVDANAIPDDVIVAFGLESMFPNLLYDELRNRVSNVLTAIDLDDCDELRNMTPEDIEIYMKSKKYNI